MRTSYKKCSALYKQYILIAWQIQPGVSHPLLTTHQEPEALAKLVQGGPILQPRMKDLGHCSGSDVWASSAAGPPAPTPAHGYAGGGGGRTNHTAPSLSLRLLPRHCPPGRTVTAALGSAPAPRRGPVRLGPAVGVGVGGREGCEAWPSPLHPTLWAGGAGVQAAPRALSPWGSPRGRLPRLHRAVPRSGPARV
ncbi:hypothetical protein KIL84_019206 [Mauremys mutica]|uniref:Uncharacterized protein n=1 Tax=Mauremys mutica TaxID=74926 RepID=A0A9D3XUW3_9SAUR|nr:hypothetical protein KIL84_019206 [Mauremys mutica]